MAVAEIGKAAVHLAPFLLGLFGSGGNQQLDLGKVFGQSLDLTQPAFQSLLPDFANQARIRGNVAGQRAASRFGRAGALSTGPGAVRSAFAESAAANEVAGARLQLDQGAINAAMQLFGPALGVEQFNVQNQPLQLFERLQLALGNQADPSAPFMALLQLLGIDLGEKTAGEKKSKVKRKSSDTAA